MKHGKKPTLKQKVRIGNSAANPVTTEHLLKECYLEDDCTVCSSADGSSVAGKVIRIGPDGIAVEIG